MIGSHNLAEDGNIENENLASIAGQFRWLPGSPSHLSSRIDPAAAI